jgi:penicillin-binding protein 1A
MEENGFITAEQAKAAKEEELKVRTGPDAGRVHAEYVAETVRQLVYNQYGDETYTRGLNVYTTLRASDQTVGLQGPAQGHHGL